MAFPQTTPPNYQATNQFQGTDGGSPVEPFIIPPEYGPGSQANPGALVVQVAQAAGPKWSSSSLPVIPANPDFALKWLTLGSGKATTTAQIIASSTSNVWNLKPAARAALKANFDLMCQGLEGLEYQGQLAPGFAYLIAQRTAEAMPLGYSETLLYRCNYTPLNPANSASAHGFVDLVPGMRLRVEAASGLFSGPGSNFNGFAGTGASYWQITRRRSDQAILFDSFAANIISYAPMANATGLWGLVDLQSAGNSRYIRLFYPQSQFAAWPGYASASEMCTIVGTQYLVDMAAATAAYTSGRPVPPSGKGPISCAYLRGQAVMVPEVPIWINRSTVFYVPVGTTARQFIEAFAIPTFTYGAQASQGSASQSSQGNKPASSQSGDFQASASVPVTVYRAWSPWDMRGALTQQITGVADGMFATGTDGWDLPLVRSDNISFTL